MSILPPTFDSLYNSPLSQFGRKILGIPSTHVSAAGVVHGGMGGKFGVPESTTDHVFGSDGANILNNPTAQGVANSSFPPDVLDYLNAELAKHYGMSKETAYQEALSNTSYQRAVKDMQAAGLNPAAIFGAGRGSGASGVSYVSSNSPVGSGGSGRTTAKQQKLFSEGEYYGMSSIIGLIGSIITNSPTGYWIASQTAQGLMTAANSAWQNRNK